MPNQTWPGLWNERSKEFKVFLGIFFIVVVCVGVWFPFSPIMTQNRNYKKATNHLPIVRRAIGHDRRYANVGLYVYASGDICVDGTVATGPDLVNLKNMIEATSAPVEVRYFSVFVLNP